MNVQGHAALVTGGASGLGEGTARALAAAGAKVAILDVNLEGAQRVAADIGGLAVQCDVSSAAAAEGAVAEAKAAHGGARVLVNCAGIAPPARIVGKNGPMPLENFARIIEINLIGTFNMIRLAAADMVDLDPLADGERGCVVSTASVAAFEGQIGQSAYAASKGGVHALTIVCAREFARNGIRFNTIAPGMFATPLMESLPDEVQAALAAAVPFPSRLGTAEEYAAMAMTMVENVMLNGETVRLDGAIRMQAR
ncbi:MAG: SDR family NAD(P)-dependent oxidoreductase [Pseudomonadota bacterium]|nr:SDR family NAD(P)-dependent oxidoreductase [Pseudomonadota bacterium]